MSALGYLLLIPAGIGAGLTGSIGGIASLISYPALLATGLPAVSANVTNTVSLVFSSVGAVHGSRPELQGQKERVRRLGIIGVLGGVCGSVLLLATPAGAFERVVPWLIGLASLLMLVRRPVPEQQQAGYHDGLGHRGGDWRGLPGAVFLVGVYGGYFGAAAGVLLLALLLAATSESLARSNAAKNVVLGLANGVAALGFALFGPVQWAAVLPLAFGSLIGGRIGPLVVRHAPATLIRVLIALGGLGLASYLAVTAYG